jgi:hypothetical protein
MKDHNLVDEKQLNYQSKMIPDILWNNSKTSPTDLKDNCANNYRTSPHDLSLH